MKLQGWKGGLYRLSEWIMNLAYMNLLWIAFTLLGLIVFGLMPATVAMFAVLRKWMMGNLNLPVFQAFWKFYRKDFLKSNVTGLVLFVIGYILYIDITVFEFGQSIYGQIHQLGVFIIAIIYTIALVFFFPLYVQYDLKWFQYIKLSFLTGVSSPFRAIWMLFLVYGLYFVITKIPGFILFFGGSVTGYLWLMIALPLFAKLEKKGVR
jgi:uncharacterized membrane protein YesL